MISPPRLSSLAPGQAWRQPSSRVAASTLPPPLPQWRGERRWSHPAHETADNAEEADEVNVAADEDGTDAAPQPSSRSTLISPFIQEQMESCSNSLGILLLAEDEFIRALRRVVVMEREDPGAIDPSAPLLAFFGVNAFVRMCIHETCRRFALSSRSFGDGEERCLQVYRTRGTVIPLVRYADMLPSCIGASRRSHLLSTFCSTAIALFDTPPRSFHICAVNPERPSASSAAKGDALMPLSHDWKYLGAPARRDRGHKHPSPPSPPVMCGVDHILLLRSRDSHAFADEAIDAVIAAGGWNISASDEGCRAAAVRQELLRILPMDTRLAILVCPSPAAASAALPKLAKIGVDAELLPLCSADVLTLSGLPPPQQQQRGARDTSSARRFIERSLRSKW